MKITDGQLDKTKKDNIQYLSYSLWLISLSMIPSKSKGSGRGLQQCHSLLLKLLISPTRPDRSLKIPKPTDNFYLMIKWQDSIQDTMRDCFMTLQIKGKLSSSLFLITWEMTWDIHRSMAFWKTMCKSPWADFKIIRRFPGIWYWILLPRWQSGWRITGVEIWEYRACTRIGEQSAVAETKNWLERRWRNGREEGSEWRWGRFRL